MRHSFFWRAYGSLTLLILASTVLAGILTDRWMAERTVALIERQLQYEARLAGELSRPGLEGTMDEAALEERIRRLGAGVATRLTIMDAGGRVLADSERDPERLENHATRPEVIAARSAGVGTARRYSTSVRDEMLYVAVSIPGATSGTAGFARAALPLRRVNGEVLEIHRRALGGTLITQFLVLLAAFLVMRRMTRPLATLREAAGSLATGDFSHPLPVRSRDEIGSLARSLNEIARDVRERLERSGRERSELLATLDEIGEGIVIVDREERVAQMNAAAGDILRAPPMTSLGRPVWEVVRHARVTELVDAALQERAEAARVAGIPSVRGEVVVDLRASPLYGPDGAVTGAVLVFEDVTELTRLERMRRDFTANVTHELKTPLTALRGLVETLREEPSMEPRVRADFLARIEDQTGRLTRLVNDLLTLTRVESGEEGPEKRELDLREPVREAVRTYRAAGEKKGLDIADALADEPVRVLGDRAALRRVSENLLDNAIKYTASGGRIEVRVFARGPHAIFEVEDTGVGIAPGEQERIFERFYRVDRARVRDDERGGAGIGLSIVKRIALALGGDVSVLSRPGSGSIFSVRLPLAGASR